MKFSVIPKKFDILRKGLVMSIRLFSISLFFLLLIVGNPCRSNVLDNQNENGSPEPDIAYCDVLVVGGGTAGIPAAIQAGRAGAKTILVELNQLPGGTTTTAGVRYPGLFHAWGKQIIAGIGWELVCKAVELNGDKMPNFSVDHGLNHWRLSIPVNPLLFSLLAEEMCLNAGVEIRYYEAPSKLEPINNKNQPADAPYPVHWKVTTASMGNIRFIYCKEMIDGTGNGSVAALAGCVRMRDHETQPGSIFYTIDSGIDPKKADWKEIKRLYHKALHQGTLLPQDMVGGVTRFLIQPRPAGNRTYVYNADNSTGPLRTDTNIRGRQSILRSLRFVRSLPGGENAKLVALSGETGVRETWRVQGLYIITGEDYRSGKVWDDSIAFAFYPVDIHRKDGVNPERLKEGTVPTIPYRALIAAKADHLFIAGRCISSDRAANSGLRVQSVCMASGQVVGAAAALAAQKNCLPLEVNLQELKDLLKKHGAIVPNDFGKDRSKPDQPL